MLQGSLFRRFLLRLFNRVHLKASAFGPTCTYMSKTLLHSTPSIPWDIAMANSFGSLLYVQLQNRPAIKHEIIKGGLRKWKAEKISAEKILPHSKM